MSLCAMCSMGLPSSCLGGFCGQTEAEHQQEHHSPTLLGIPISSESDESDDLPSRRSSRSGSRSRGRRNLNDSQSSGRKEAAKLFPLDDTKPCEWQGKANCGGGDFPILGCPEGATYGVQQARHHGPDKNVSSNHEGNVHRICHYCHYRWHAKNDKTYDWNAGFWPLHEPRPMTDQEVKSQLLDYMRYEVSGRRKKEVINE